MSIEAMRQALEYVQEFKRRWWAVPPFGNKVNKATREAVSAAHSPIFQIEDALRAAIEQAEKRQWVELTDDEARALVNRVTFGDRTNWQALVYMIDAKLKEKNAA